VGTMAYPHPKRMTVRKVRWCRPEMDVDKHLIAELIKEGAELLGENVSGGEA